MNIEDSQLEDERNITPEERQSIAQEMEEILATRKSQATSDRLAISGSTKSFSFPIYVNIIICLLFLGSVGGVYAYFFREDRQFLSLQATTNFSENVLARLIIDEAQKAIEEQESKIASVNEQLEEQRKKQSLLEKQIDERVQIFIAEAKEELETKLNEFRKKLEGQGISAAEIKRRIKEYQQQLRKEQEEELASYKKGQEDIRKKEVAHFNANIRVLQQQIDDRQSQIQSLEQNLNSEKEALQQQLQQQREANSKEIAQAQQQITTLKKRNEQRFSAVKSIGLSYNALLNAFNNGKYGDARNILKNVKVSIEKSAYKNDEEFVRMTRSLSSLSNALETIDLLQGQISEQSEALQDIGFSEEVKELKQTLIDEQKKITRLEKEIEALNGDTKSVRELLTSREDELETLKNGYVLLENKHKDLQSQVNKNMQIIVNYLMLKKQGADAQTLASLKTLVDGLVKKNKYYRVIGVLLAQALDSSGQLQF